MNELKCKYQYIPTVTLHIAEEIATTRLGTSANEGFEVQLANLVEVFLVEMYRCKICQFTTSIKNKIKIHVSSDHQLDRIHLISESPGIGPDQEENDNYSLVDEIGQENKENEVNLEKMPFLLPMYRILNTMSPDSCDISLGDHIDSGQVAHTCEVNTLFEEESSNFQLDESASVVSNTIPCSADASESKKSTDDEEAQSEHLMSLGLCRTSSIRSQAVGAEVKSAMPEAKWESNISHQKDNIQHGYSQKNNFPLRLRVDRRKHFCDICECKLQSKESYKIHMKCHSDEQGFKCLHCSCYMPDWNLMEKHIETHVPSNNAYKCLVCDKEFVMRSAWKLHRKTQHKKLSVFQCTKCPSFYTSEQVRNLHVACHYEDQFKCLHCDLKDKEWKKVYKHLCTHDYNINPHPCLQCKQRFFRVAELKEHIAKHKASSSSLCSLCGQAFKCRRQMNKHHRRIHQKQNAYECKSRRKGQASTLNHPDTDEITKTRKRSSNEYSCNACSRKCSSKLALQRHMGVHAGVTPFHCPLCEYKTRLKASLIQHMRIHTGEKPFRCKTCSYASIDASSLRRHCRTHTSERPYTCPLCSYCCIQKKSLDLHVRRHHTGEAFSCGFCRYSSPDKQLLQKHVRKHHFAMENSLADEEPTSDSKTFAASE